MLKQIASNGTEYELGYRGSYFWHRSGATAEALQGRFTRIRDAMDAMHKYNASLAQEIVYSDKELEELTKKSELLGYAERNNIEVPSKHKTAGAIKKFLKGGYE